MKLQPGRSLHYKGKEYIVLGVARHSETEEELVVYQQDYGQYGLWVRPLAIFHQTIEVDGNRVPRFDFVGGNQSLACPSHILSDRINLLNLNFPNV